MANTIECFITSVSEEIYRGEIESLSAVGSEGELGITPGHAPLLTELVPGPVQVKKPEGEELIFYISGGFLEVRPTVIHVLADEAIREKGLDAKAIEEARQKAAEAIADGDKRADYELASAKMNLIRTAAQLKTLRRIKSKLGK